MDDKFYDETLPEKFNKIAEHLQIKKLEEYNKNIWLWFCELKVMRDKIIHPKFSYFNTAWTDWSELIISKVLNGKFKWKMLLAMNIIKYFKDNEPKKEGDTLIIWARWLQGNPLKI